MVEFHTTSKYDGQRFGQAFYNHFNLHKSNHDPELDRLYNMVSEIEAKAFIRGTLIDYAN
jgi:hypothetical protein